MPITLWDHQRAAVEFAQDRRGALLHMGMRTGKTRTAVTLVSERWRPQLAIVLCPKAVIPTWVEHFEEFDASRRVLALTAGAAAAKAKRVADAVARPGTVAIVLNYESSWRARLAAALLNAAQARSTALVLDESQKIKSHKGAQSKFARKLSVPCRHVLGLTGTPMPHSFTDIWAQAAAIEPTVYGESFFRFRRFYAEMGGFEGKVVKGLIPDRAGMFRDRLAGFTFQASRDVLDLPPDHHVRVPVQLSSRGQAIYDRMFREFEVELADGEVVSAANALVRLLRLQQVTGGALPGEGGDIHDVDTAKADAFREILEELPHDEPVVCFCRFRSDIASARQVALDVARGSLELSGERNDLQAWKDESAPTVLVAQIQSGGIGVDLTRAAHCVFWSLGFSLGDYEQALARIHGPEQKSSRVVYHHLIARDTVDEHVYAALRAKKSAVDSILEGLTHGHREAAPVRRASAS